jgi:ribosomal protein S18 acetylase RimI-like enzyme
MKYVIREIHQSEIPLLKDFTYEAIYQRDENNPVSRDILNRPELKVFYEKFGKPDDLCFIAEVDKKIVGAVWTRILSGPTKGFGNIDDETPEFAISLCKEYRGKGIGTALMKSMLDLLKQRGYKQTSLSVQKDNYAIKMYQAIGFCIIKETEEEYLMIHNLS